MFDAEASARDSNKSVSAVWYLAAGLAATSLVAGTIIVAVPRAAEATPAFAVKTGFSCNKCHVSPTGGAKLTPYGKAFHANGNRVPKAKKGK